MPLDLGAGASGTQYKTPHASSYDTPGTSTQVPETQAPTDARQNALAVKSDQETHTIRFSLGECFVDIDVFFIYFRDCSLYIYFI
jgi:hypothetical protein